MTNPASSPTVESLAPELLKVMRAYYEACVCQNTGDDTTPMCAQCATAQALMERLRC